MPLLPQDFHHPPRTLCLGVAATSPRGRAAGVWKQGLPPMKKTLEELFWSKVDKSAGPDACWPWTGGLHGGYGRIMFNKERMLAHRVSWVLTNGAIPPGLCSCHRCDNPCCVNPSHLFLGTVTDNNADCTAKGRRSSGDAHRAIMRRLAARGEANGSRKHPERRPRGSNNGSARLTESLVVEIRTRCANGESQRAVARSLHVASNTVRDIIIGKRWRHV